MSVQMEESWKKALNSDFNSDYMKSLKTFLADEIDQKKTIYPHGKEFFRALDLTPLDKVKVVIIGQDPYHGPHQAHGLCFSVKPGVRTPPSLQNIYKELKSDLDIPIASHGHLENWAKQGVLLLNATLSVEAGKAGSHQGKGWEQLTDRIIEELNSQRENLVFLLWGSFAQKKAQCVSSKKHLVLKAPHPSPLSAYRGFLGCKHFSKTNQYLESTGQSPIDWQLPTPTTDCAKG